MKKVKDWTYKDFIWFRYKRSNDGNWDEELALDCTIFVYRLCEQKRNYMEKYWQENKHKLFNLKDYPNLAFDIETGEYEV